MTKEKKSRRRRVDTKDAAVEAMIAAKDEIVPPSDMRLSNEQSVIFGEIIDEFANVDWSNHTIRLAAMLATMIHGLKEAQEEMGTDFVVDNAKGNPVPNPLMSVTNSFNAQILAMRRSLSLQTTGRAVDVGKRRNINKRHEADSPLGEDEDDLLATP